MLIFQQILVCVIISFSGVGMIFRYVEICLLGNVSAWMPIWVETME
jgi:hypothetical protein